MEWNGCLLPLTNVLKELLSKMYIKILKKFDSPLDLLMHFWIRCEWVSVNDKLVHCNGLPFNKNEQSTANSYNSTSNAYPHVWHVCVCVKMEMILRLLMQFPYERAICQQHTYTTSLMVDFLYYIFIALAQKTIILREIYYFPWDLNYFIITYSFGNLTTFSLMVPHFY